jgi:hypothetical protein
MREFCIITVFWLMGCFGAKDADTGEGVLDQ